MWTPLWKSEVPFIALEANGSRSAVSAKQLSNHPFFWTVDSAFFASAEALVKEIPAPIAISSLAEIVASDLFRLPPDPYISAQQRDSSLYAVPFRNREVDRIVVHRDQRRVDMRWRKVGDAPIWRSAIPTNKDARAMFDRVFERMPGTSRRAFGEIHVAQQEVERAGLGEEIAIISVGRTFVLPGSAYSRYLLGLIRQLAASSGSVKLGAYVLALRALAYRGRISQPAEFIKRELAEINRELRYGYVLDVQEDPELMSVLGTTNFSVFDPQSWVRGRL